MNLRFHLTCFVVLLLASVSHVRLVSGATESLKYQDEYWGPDEHAQVSDVDETIRDFNIVFDKEMIDDLTMRLKNTRLPQPSMKNESWNYGTNSKFVAYAVDYWLNKYDFEKREKHLNKYPQFLTNIQGLDIHFIHVKPELKDDSKLEIVPMYMQHGWLGSPIEFFQVAQLLTTAHPNRDFVFELIMPSLPGFGYSDAAARPGLSTVEIAHVMKNLMLRLGFTKWYIHGNDWGGFITANMATLFPEHILGLHSSGCLELNPISWAKEILRQTPSYLIHFHKKWDLLKFLIWLYEEIGFIFLQSTRPDTIGAALSDSPSGLVSYIFEKFVGSTREDWFAFGNKETLLKEENMDDLLDILMMYWVPNKTTSAMRLHAEFISARNLQNKTIYAQVKVPSACVQFPSGLINLPERLLRERFVNMVSYSEPLRGGHFPAMEAPKPLANDIWEAIGKMRYLQQNKKKGKKSFISKLLAYLQSTDAVYGNK